ncbi:hypothetical protein WICPIJ_009157 [Wickerhamomyces pijperi]|uniref:protein-tyrosine-phosphatase n=1 Tax=Wickerhamomyces pijperi TaxID=599730 RepID=A0A9P8PQL8_WICPI|nr:hypothetical protein WICPIJ_009157 [Wickerhamomyces pijperi]
MDRILGGLYISGYDAFIREGDIAEKYNITHIVTVFKGALPEDYYDRFTIKGIEIDDLVSTNIIQYFEETNQFINTALFPDEQDEIAVGVKKKHHTNIAIICQAGQSRSVAILAAYLMKKYKLTLDQSLHAIQRKREDSKLRVNESFMDQLQLYQNMRCVINPMDQEYRQWLLSNSLMNDPTGKDLINNNADSFKEEQPPTEEDNTVTQIRCSKCRQHLAYSTSFVPHDPPTEDSKQSLFIRRVPNKRKIISVEAADSICSHYFLEPLDWMKRQLTNEDELEGKFCCFKCQQRVGGYNWKGSRCSCGKWMVPAIYLQKVKVHQLKVNSEGTPIDTIITDFKNKMEIEEEEETV